MAFRGRRKRQIARYLPWILLFIPALAVPVVVIWLTSDSGWMNLCKARLLYFDLSEYRCEQARLAVWVLGAFGAFGVSVLLWWIFTELTGLTRIFEVPWFGVGDDVESVGVMESLVRAAIFVLFFWLCLGMLVLALVGALPLWPALGNSGGAPPAVLKPGGPESSSVSRASETPRTPEERKLDVTILEEIRKINDGIVVIDKRLASLDQKLVIPEQIQRKIDEWSPKADAQLASTAASILKDTGSLNGALGEIKKEAENLNKIFSSVKQDIGGSNATLTEIKNQLIMQDQHLALLQLIYETLATKGSDVSSGSCIDVAAEAKSRSGAAAANEPATPEQSKERVRIVAARAVFFDKGESKLTPRATGDLETLLKGPTGPDTAVMIRGSADPQGSQERNAKLSRQRADAIENFVRTKNPSLPIKNKGAAGAVGEPKSEPYQRTAVIQLVQPCH